jgi:hypothetical protein
MVVDTGTAILILGVFVLPGFITLIFRERLYVVRGHEGPSDRMLSALLYSGLIYGMLLVVAHAAGLQKVDLVEFHKGGKSLGDDLLAALVILLLAPGAITVVGSRWMASKSLRPSILSLVGSSDAHSATSAWNQLFDDHGSCLIRATLADGRIVGGFYDRGSLAGYSEQAPDLYMSQRWEIDDNGWFAGPADRSLGIWLSAESIVSLEIYAFEGMGDMERKMPKISG